MPLLAGAIGTVIGGFWAFMEASGAEVDVCSGQNCTSGWYYAAPILIASVVVGVIGVALLRAERNRSRSRERLT